MVNEVHKFTSPRDLHRPPPQWHIASERQSIRYLSNLPRLLHTVLSSLFPAAPPKNRASSTTRSISPSLPARFHNHHQYTSPVEISVSRTLPYSSPSESCQISSSLKLITRALRSGIFLRFGVSNSELSGLSSSTSVSSSSALAA